MKKLEGSWSLPDLAGGCPKHPSWPQNPQYRLIPKGPAGQVCEIKLSCAAKLPIGFVVLRTTAADVGGRKAMASKLASKDVAFKTKWKAEKSMTGNCATPPLPGGLSYVIIPCTFDPGSQASFELLVSSDDPFTLEPLPTATAAKATELTCDIVSASAVAPGADWAHRCGPACKAGCSNAAMTSAGTAVQMLATPSRVVVTREGQGLSAKQESDAQAMVAEAVRQCTTSGRKYEDADFPPTVGSLWRDGVAPGPELAAAGLAADPVARWRRPEEFSSEPRLFMNEWQIAGVVPSVLPNAKLLAAANIVAGDPDVISRVYIDTEHAAQGFYMLRFFHDDPRSDDDWKVVLVDDRLPCGADGTPCFGHSPSEGVLWAALVEKAIAKLLGSYEVRARALSSRCASPASLLPSPLPSPRGRWGAWEERPPVRARSAVGSPHRQHNPRR